MTNFQSPFVPEELERARYSLKTAAQEDRDLLVSFAVLILSPVFTILIALASPVSVGRALVAGFIALVFAGVINGGTYAYQALRRRRVLDAREQIRRDWTLEAPDEAEASIRQLQLEILATDQDRRFVLQPLWHEAIVAAAILRLSPHDEREITHLASLAVKARSYRIAEENFKASQANAEAQWAEARALDEKELAIKTLRAARDPLALASVEMATEALRENSASE